MSLTILTCTVIAVTVLAICTAEPIEFKTCSNAAPTIKSVDIDPCPNAKDKQPCIFHHETNVTVKVTFVAPTPSNNLTAQIFGIVSGVLVPFSMPNSNGCKDSGIACPIKQQDEHTYVQLFYVQKLYPSIKLLVQWDLKSGDDYEFCFVFPVTIEN